MEPQEHPALRVTKGHAFYAQEVTVNFSPTMFTLDFKNIVPQTEPKDHSVRFHVEHNPILVDPWHAKMIHQVLGKMIEQFEKELCPIEKPPALTRAQEKQERQIKDQKHTHPGKHTTPSYFG